MHPVRTNALTRSSIRTIVLAVFFLQPGLVRAGDSPVDASNLTTDATYAEVAEAASAGLPNGPCDPDAPGNQPTPAIIADRENGEIWAESSLTVGDLEACTKHAALQSGASFGGRLLTWDVFEQITGVFGSSSGADLGGFLQLYQGAGGGLTVELDGEDGNGNGSALWRNAALDTTVRISGADHRIYTYGTNDAEHARLGGSGSGNLQLRAGGANNPMTVNLNSVGGGTLDLLDSGGSDFGVRLSGGSSATGGLVRVYDHGNNSTVELAGDYQGGGGGALTLRHDGQDAIMIDAGAPRIRFFDPANVETLRCFGNGAGGGGGVSIRNSAGTVTMELDGDESDNPVLRVNDASGTTRFALNVNNQEFRMRGARIRGQNDAGGNTVELNANAGDGSGTLILRRSDGTLGVLARATEGTGSELNLYNDAGDATIQIDTDWSGTGNSRIVANQIQITQGSDLSEQFEVSEAHGAAEPGMVVCIDPDNPGHLTLCDAAYDQKVAGVISGAGGVKTGMYMGHHGTEADGRIPVALTGRVYCRVDARFSSVKPGDLLTTSSTPGHAMKVSDRTAAQGATIGKAMTPLATGQGLVLVLVNLQ